MFQTTVGAISFFHNLIGGIEGMLFPALLWKEKNMAKSICLGDVLIGSASPALTVKTQKI